MSGLGWKQAEVGIRNVHWVIEWQGTWAITPRRIEHHLPGVDALRAFFKACDEGKVGTYTLRGMAAQKDVVLATAEVNRYDMTISWKPEWILFSLGAKGMYDAVPAVVAYLCEHDASFPPKEGA